MKKILYLITFLVLSTGIFGFSDLDKTIHFDLADGSQITINSTIIAGTNIGCSDVTGASYDVCLGDGGGSINYTAVQNYTDENCTAGYVPIGRMQNGSWFCVVDQIGSGSFNPDNITLILDGTLHKVNMSFINNTIDARASAGNTSWNQTHADTLYASISVVTDNSSWSQAKADTLYASLLRAYWTTENFTATNLTYWYAAYLWGNHALAGYLTSYTDTNASTACSGSYVLNGDGLCVPNVNTTQQIFDVCNNGSFQLIIGMDTETELEGILTDVTDIYTDNDGVLYNTTWNQTHADTLYADISVVTDNASWNQGVADGLYSTVDGNLSWNQTHADTIYATIGSENLTTLSWQNITNWPICPAGDFYYNDGTLQCGTPTGGASGGDKWTDNGTYISPNGTFASNVVIEGYLKVKNQTNITIPPTQIIGLNTSVNNSIDSRVVESFLTNILNLIYVQPSRLYSFWNTTNFTATNTSNWYKAYLATINGTFALAADTITISSFSDFWNMSAGKLKLTNLTLANWDMLGKTFYNGTFNGTLNGPWNGSSLYTPTASMNTETELEGILTDVADIYTNNDGVLYNTTWNQSLADTLYADISVVDTTIGNCSTGGICGLVTYDTELQSNVSLLHTNINGNVTLINTNIAGNSTALYSAIANIAQTNQSVTFAENVSFSKNISVTNCIVLGNGAIIGVPSCFD